jgi:hypothetical protein
MVYIVVWHIRLRDKNAEASGERVRLPCRKQGAQQPPEYVGGIDSKKTKRR